MRGQEGAALNVARDKQRCIEDVLSNLHTQASDLFSSASSIADKLYASPKQTTKGDSIPQPSDILNQLEALLEILHKTGSELTRAHIAING